MFEVAEAGADLSEDADKARAEGLRLALLTAQVQLVKDRPFPVLVLISGVDGAGKGEVVHLLNEWMDPRHVETYAVGDASKIERERPSMWRFWMNLPPKGKIGLFFGSWYTAPLYDRAYAKIGRGRFDADLDQIVRFEKMLTDEGVLLIKVWLHLSKRAQRKIFKRLSRSRRTRWRVTASDRKNHAHYGRFKRTAEDMVRRTSTGNAPWLVVDGSRARHRNLTVAEALTTAIQRRLALMASPPAEATPAAPAAVTRSSIIASLNHGQTLAPDEYAPRLQRCQGELNRLSRLLKARDRSMVIAFEGFDAAGKGGAIRRVADALDARHYKIIPIAAPTDEERARPYLWRFWRHLPARGAITIFDRTWYGRVLVERVEGLCTEPDWMRAYTEINDFEDQLASHGALLAKFWISVTPEEQLRRFEDRQRNELKRFKLTDDDWRNREQRVAYEQAVTDMVERTSTTGAPWTLVEGDDKAFARIKVLETLIAQLEDGLSK